MKIFEEEYIYKNIEQNIKNIEYTYINKQNIKMILKICEDDLKFFEKSKEINFYLNFDNIEVLELDYLNENGEIIKKIPNLAVILCIKTYHL